jgi:hypothetical protein
MSTPSANVDVATVTDVQGSFVFPARMIIPVTANTSFVFTLARNESVLGAAPMYESLSLDSAVATLHVGPAPSGTVGMCFHSNTTPFNNAHSTQGATHSSLVFAAADSVNAVLDLPRGHAFGRELKGVAIGNTPPSFHVVASGFSNSTTVATVTLHFLLRGSGLAADPLVIPAPQAASLVPSSRSR